MTDQNKYKEVFSGEKLEWPDAKELFQGFDKLSLGLRDSRRGSLEILIVLARLLYTLLLGAGEYKILTRT